MISRVFKIKATAMYNRREDVPFWRKVTGFEPSTGTVSTTLRLIGK
jgi:hypothetical protein